MRGDSWREEETGGERRKEKTVGERRRQEERRGDRRQEERGGDRRGERDRMIRKGKEERGEEDRDRQKERYKQTDRQMLISMRCVCTMETQRKNTVKALKMHHGTEIHYALCVDKH